MNLRIGDRLALIHQLLLMQASTVEKLLMQDMAKRVEITTAEAIEHRLTIVNGKPDWNRELSGKDFAFSEAEMALLRKKANQLDAAEQVTDLSVNIVKTLQEAKKE
jgi:hypothetical protein